MFIWLSTADTRWHDGTAELHVSGRCAIRTHVTETRRPTKKVGPVPPWLASTIRVELQTTRFQSTGEERQQKHPHTYVHFKLDWISHTTALATTLTRLVPTVLLRPMPSCPLSLRRRHGEGEGEATDDDGRAGEEEGKICT